MEGGFFFYQKLLVIFDITQLTMWSLYNIYDASKLHRIYTQVCILNFAKR